MAAWIGEVFGGEYIHVCVWLSLFAVHLKPSQHCLSIGYIPIQNKKLKKKEIGSKSPCELPQVHMTGPLPISPTILK